MAEREIRTFREGELRWVQASGTAGWATASAAATGLVGYVQAGISTTEQWNYVTITDRGIPMMHKFQGKNAPEVSFTVKYGITAQYPPMITASGVSTPQIHLELKMREEEWATGSGMYYQWHNCVLMSKQFTEAEDGNTLALSYRALAVSGSNASGYLA